MPEVVEPVKRAIAESAEQRSDQRLGLTARRAAILAAVVCVLTLTIAGPVRTYFAQRTEMKQLAASEAALRGQITDLEQQKVKLADPAYVAAQARERLGFVRPGEIPYQIQLPPNAALPAEPGSTPTAATTNDPWYTSLWHTIADNPHGPPTPPTSVAPAAAESAAARWLTVLTSTRWPASSAANREECSMSPTGVLTANPAWCEQRRNCLMERRFRRCTT